MKKYFVTYRRRDSLLDTTTIVWANDQEDAERQVKWQQSDCQSIIKVKEIN